MAVDYQSLLDKTSTQLRCLRRSYALSREVIRKAPSTRGMMLATDVRRCNDAIKLIDSILRVRARRGVA